MSITDHLQIIDNSGDDSVCELIGWFDDFEERPTNPYRFLSNFYIGREPIILPGLPEYAFMTGEHAYAAMKAYGVRNGAFERIVDARTPQEAKTIGRLCRMRSDWETVKYDVMMAIMRNKFTLDRDEGPMLLATGDALLIESTYWEDQVWGVDLETAKSEPGASPGRNWLGTMLMARRAELKAEAYFGQTSVAGIYNSHFTL